MTTNPELCQLCDRTQREHKAAEEHGVVHHPFAGPGQPLKHLGGEVKGKKESPGTVVTGPNLPSDPVLRFVLISKGIITGDELSEMEKSLKGSGVLRTHGHPGG